MKSEELGVRRWRTLFYSENEPHAVLSREASTASSMESGRVAEEVIAGEGFE